MSNAGKKTGKPLSDRQVPGTEAQASASNSGAADQVHSLGVGGDQSVGNAGGEGGGGAAAGDSAADLPDADGTANSSDSASAAGPVVAAADVGSPAPDSVMAQSGVEALPTSAGEPSDSIVIIPPEPGPPGPSAINLGEVEVFPLRTYQDAGELRRRGGKGYVVDKRHAVALVQRGLATLEDPEE